MAVSCHASLTLIASASLATAFHFQPFHFLGEPAETNEVTPRRNYFFPQLSVVVLIHAQSLENNRLAHQVALTNPVSRDRTQLEAN